MRGFVNTKTGVYYEADAATDDSCVEVPLRPSEAYVLNSNLQWVLDRRRISQAQAQAAQRPTTPQYSNQAGPYDYQQPQMPPLPHHYQLPPMAAPVMPQPQSTQRNVEDDQKVVKYAMFEFLAKNWHTLGSMVLALFGMYVTFNDRINELTGKLKETDGKIVMLQEQLKETSKKLAEVELTVRNQELMTLMSGSKKEK